MGKVLWPIGYMWFVLASMQIRSFYVVVSAGI